MNNSLQAFRLQNYKVFRDTGWIELSNLTLLLGYNSNGKSTILKALEFVRKCYMQTQTGQEYPPLVTNDSEDGTFEDCFSQNSNKETEYITFSFRFAGGMIKDDYRDVLHELMKLLGYEEIQEVDRVEYSVSIGENNGASFIKKVLIKVQDEDIYLYERQDNGQLRATCFLKNGLTLQMPIMFDIYNTFFLRQTTVILNIAQNGTAAKNLFEQEKMNYIDSIERLSLEVINGCMRNFASEIEYILPLRVSPTRQMMLQTDKTIKIGLNGENVYRILYNAYFSEQTDLKEKVNSWLAYFGYSFEWNMLKPNYGEFMLVDLKTGHIMNIVDVGFGISQVLPIIVSACEDASGYLLLDSPEAHLHSKMQSVLGDLLIEAGKKRTVLVETHSENILLRLQKRIVQGLDQEVTKDFVKIYFIHEVGQDTICEPIILDDLGQFMDCSQEFRSFFNDGFNDIMEMTMLKSQKMK